MKQDEIASYYRQVSATGANPAGMIVKLYDRILEDFRRADEAISVNDIKGRVESLNHALLIIAELDSVLDFERGGIVAQHLHGFYSVTRGLIVEANVRTSAQHINQLVDLYMPLRQAWQQVEQEVAQQKIQLPAGNRFPEARPRPAVESASRRSVTVPAEPETVGSPLERVMKDSVVERVRGTNSKIRALISRLRESLGGRGNFGVMDVREMEEPVAMMQSIVAQADELRTIHPDLNGELEAYAGNLGEMQVALEQMRFMILARRAHIEAMRSHVETLGMWTAAVRLTQ